MKNILFILQLPPPVHGSSTVGKYIKDSKKINKAFSGRYLNLLASKKVSESGKVSIRKLMNFFFIWIKLIKELLKKKPDLCYLAITATGAAFYRDILLIFLLKVFNVRRIYHMHNKGVKDYQDHPIHDLFYKLAFNKADVILLSNHLYSDIEKYVSKEHVHICPNGIPEMDTKKTQQKIKNLPRILFLSNLIQSKGVFVLLQACSMLKKKGLKFECIIIGGEVDLSSQQLNKEINALNLKGVVVYAGKKYGEKKEKAYSRADIFAFPTSKESFGLVNLEAMQFSLPVVSTIEGGIPDVIEDGRTGFLIPTQNVQALSEKLEVLIRNDKLRQQMGKAGRKKYEQQFTLKKFEERMIEILDTILST